MQGTFSDQSLQVYTSLVAGKNSSDFSETEAYDYTRCVRPNGTAYGTGGTCKKGKESTKQLPLFSTPANAIELAHAPKPTRARAKKLVSYIRKNCGASVEWTFRGNNKYSIDGTAKDVSKAVQFLKEKGVAVLESPKSISHFEDEDGSYTVAYLKKPGV
jgi:hypothetical protein